MRFTLTALTLIMCLGTGPSWSQTDAHEIQILVSKAPVVEAAAEAGEGVDWIIPSQWLTTLSYSGRVDDAFAAASKIKSIESDSLLYALAEGLSIAGRTDEALAKANIALIQ